jgi:RNase P protein component
MLNLFALLCGDIAEFLRNSDIMQLIPRLSFLRGGGRTWTIMYEHEESAAGLQKVFLVLNSSWRWHIGLLSQKKKNKKKVQFNGARRRCKLMVHFNGSNGGCSLWQLITYVTINYQYLTVHES